MSVVIFDFDGTIIRQDTVRSYVWFFFRKGHFRCVLAFVYFALLKLKLIDHTTFKINIARVCFWETKRSLYQGANTWVAMGKVG